MGTTEDWSKCRHMFRFDACLLRARIDESNKIKDMRVLAKMLEDAEHEVWEAQHYDPKIFKLTLAVLSIRGKETHLIGLWICGILGSRFSSWTSLTTERS